MRSEHPNGGLEFKDRAFNVAELRLVQDIVADHGRLSRRELANTVCELLNWRRPHGGLKTWEAKELLAGLDYGLLVRLLCAPKPRVAVELLPSARSP